MAAEGKEGVYVTAEQTRELEELNREVNAAHILGEWQIERAKEQPSGGVPYIWKRELTRKILSHAGQALRLNKGARRGLLFMNPGIPQQSATLGLRAAVSMMNPHEVALAHRHAPSALRFVIEGHPDAYTLVNGEKLVMNENDLLLTPAFSWHHHVNHSDQEVVWFDTLDVGLIRFLNVYFFEPYAGGEPPLVDEAESIRHRTGVVRPAWEGPLAGSEYGLPMAYPWGPVEKQLQQLSRQEGSPFDGIILEYVNPVTGGSALSTIDCHIQMLKPAQKTASHRHTSGAVYHVIQGQGVTYAGDQELHWEKGDQFVVPNWCWHHHENTSKVSEALLFRVSDAPILKSVHLYWEQAR